jgi:hypothetical protein
MSRECQKDSNEVAEKEVSIYFSKMRASSPHPARPHKSKQVKILTSRADDIISVILRR